MDAHQVGPDKPHGVLPYGRTGEVLSAGAVPSLTLAAGLDVAAGVVLLPLTTSFLHQTLVVRAQPPSRPFLDPPGWRAQ